MTQAIVCQGCGTTQRQIQGCPPPDPVTLHCPSCPPWICADCGETDVVAGPRCGCWQSLENVSLADLKAMFADIDLSVQPDPDVQ